MAGGLDDFPALGFPACPPAPPLFAGRRLPPLSPPVQRTSTPADALRSLLHTRLALDLVDGRVLAGHLLAVDDSASLLLSSVRERRILLDTPQGRNIARWYPMSRDGEYPAASEFEEVDVDVDEDAENSLTGAGAGTAGQAQREAEAERKRDEKTRTRIRDLASILVPIAHVRAVRIVDGADARAWARYAGLTIKDGAVVPPPALTTPVPT